MPHEPGEEDISPKEQFRRLMAMSEDDLPDVPEPVEMFRSVGEPEPPPTQQPQPQTDIQPEEEQVDTRDVQERILEKLTEIQLTLMTVEDLLEQAVGGD